ncbi:MAG TPA: hypothetical protein PK609_01095 [Candidatus Paceibacterota bacterium]|nr:hypothetical protein [Candidatus Paceibacterota bacterium]
MKKLFFILLAVVVVGGLGFAIWYTTKTPQGEQVPPSESGGVFPGTSSSVRVIPASPEETIEISTEYYAEVQSATNLILSDIVVSGSYAVAVYSDENVGGMAAFRKSGSSWELLGTDGGVFNLDALVALGIPRDTARALIQTSI